MRTGWIDGLRSGINRLAGVQLVLEPDERLLFDGAGRFLSGTGRSRHLGRLVISDRRLVHVPIHRRFRLRSQSGATDRTEIPIAELRLLAVEPSRFPSPNGRILIVKYGSATLKLDTHPGEPAVRAIGQAQAVSRRHSGDSEK
jgi:hypothetical protein